MEGKRKGEVYVALRALRGAPISILVTLFVAGAAVSQQWIGEVLGYDSKTVRKTLRFLLAAGYVERPGAHRWQLPQGQLRLPGFEGLFPPGRRPALKQGNSPGFAPTTTTCSREVVEGEIVVVGREKREKIPVSDELAAAFRAAGIGRNMWDELASLPHVTPEYVEAHRAGLAVNPDRRKRNAAFLIHCMRSGDPAPDVCGECGEVNGHAASCSESYRGYTGGKYGNLFVTG